MLVSVGRVKSWEYWGLCRGLPMAATGLLVVWAVSLPFWLLGWVITGVVPAGLWVRPG